MHIRRTILFASLAMAIPLAHAAAQPAKAPPSSPTAEADPMSDKALQLFNEGKKLFRDGKYGQAEASFEAAWAIALQSKGIAANLGETEMHLGKPREAAEHLTISLRLAPPNDPQRPRTAANLATVKAKIGTLVVTANVEGAEVFVDGKKMGDTPLADPIFVDPGKIKLRVRREGYAPQEKELDVAAGQELPLAIQLALPAPPPTVSASATATAPLPPRSKGPAVVLGGVGLVSVVLGGVLVGLAEGKRSEVISSAPKDQNGNPVCSTRDATLDRDPSAAVKCDGLRGLARDGNILGDTGVGVMVGGGAVLAAAALYLLWPTSPSPSTKPTSKLVPTVGATGGGLVWIGSF